MMKQIIAIVGAVFLLAVPFGAQAAPAYMPAIIADNLNGVEQHIPDGLPGERTLLIVAFQREQQTNVDGWIDGMALARSSLPWLELPVIDNPGLLGRWVITSGMQGGIPDQNMRDHVVTLYLDKALFLDAMGITDESQCYAVVVNRKGEVITKVKGDYTADRAGVVMQALKLAKS